MLKLEEVGVSSKCGLGGPFGKERFMQGNMARDVCFEKHGPGG